MKNYGQHFRHDVGPLLTSFMEQVAQGQLTFNFDQERTLFQRVWSAIKCVADNGNIFRKDSNGRICGKFSPTLFELISLAVSWNIDKVEQMPNDELRQSVDQLIAESQKENLTGAGSNSRKKTQGRLEKAKTWFAM